jgi:hypothetical protein
MPVLLKGGGTKDPVASLYFEGVTGFCEVK